MGSNGWHDFDVNSNEVSQIMGPFIAPPVVLRSRECEERALKRFERENPFILDGWDSRVANPPIHSVMPPHVRIYLLSE